VKEYVSFSLARMVAEGCLDLYDVPFRVYVADSTGLGAPYKTGVQEPKVKLHTITLVPFTFQHRSGGEDNAWTAPRLTSPQGSARTQGCPCLLLGDPAFSSKENMTGCLMRGLIPALKPKENLKDDLLKR